MFDYVCNHISAKSEWFTEYKKGNPEYSGFFTEMDPNVDLEFSNKTEIHTCPNQV